MIRKQKALKMSFRYVNKIRLGDDFQIPKIKFDLQRVSKIRLLDT